MTLKLRWDDSPLNAQTEASGACRRRLLFGGAAASMFDPAGDQPEVLRAFPRTNDPQDQMSKQADKARRALRTEIEKSIYFELFALDPVVAAVLCLEGWTGHKRFGR